MPYKPRMVCPECIAVGRIEIHPHLYILASGREVMLTPMIAERPITVALDCSRCDNTGWVGGPG